jgi:hypothetical protein
MRIRDRFPQGIDNAVYLCRKFDVTVQVRDAQYHGVTRILSWGKAKSAVELELFPLPIDMPASTFQANASEKPHERDR